MFRVFPERIHECLFYIKFCRFYQVLFSHLLDANVDPRGVHSAGINQELRSWWQNSLNKFRGFVRATGTRARTYIFHP